jgi:hypothetical protein
MFASLVATSSCSDRLDRIATITVDAGASDGAPGIEKCVSGESELVTDMGLDLYFVLERSGENYFYEWGGVVGALSFLFHPESAEFAGMGVGFAIYPTRMPPRQSCLDNCETSGCRSCFNACGCADVVLNAEGVCECLQWRTSCLEKDYAPSFRISRVNENPDGFLSSLQRTVWDPVNPINSGDEPALYPALQASLRERAAWEAQYGRRITQVLVATSLDFPHHLECDSDDEVSDVEALLSGDNKPKTHVVAVNSSSNDNDEWDALAAAGRTEQATRIRITGPQPMTPTNDFRTVIRKIRAIDGRCEYLLPARPGVDSKKINLLSSEGNVLYPKVRNRGACDGNNQGWYFDSDDSPSMNPPQPRRIIACEATCRTLHDSDVTSVSGNARIQVDCPTVMAGEAGASSSR